MAYDHAVVQPKTQPRGFVGAPSSHEYRNPRWYGQSHDRGVTEQELRRGYELYEFDRAARRNEARRRMSLRERLLESLLRAAGVRHG